MSDIKFEMINGTLCRMVEPDTINEFSKTPCVIACKYGGLKKYYILDFPLPNPSMSMLAEGFEIIGYPVVDGSAEWALWAMMEGQKVWSFDVIDIIGEGYVAMGKWGPSEAIAFHFVNTDTHYECNDFMSIDGFLSKHRSSGWQLYEEPETDKEPIPDCDNCKHRCPKRYVDHCQMYEPKSEQQNPMPTTEFVDLSDAPSGWICKTRDGGNYPLKYIEVSPTRYAYEDKSGLTVYVMANGRYKKNGTDGRDIIACEPEQPKYKVGDLEAMPEEK